MAIKNISIQRFCDLQGVNPETEFMIKRFFGAHDTQTYEQWYTKISKKFSIGTIKPEIVKITTPANDNLKRTKR